jgi:hypothetical protein
MHVCGSKISNFLRVVFPGQTSFVFISFFVVHHLGETGWGRQTSVIMYVDCSLCKVTEIK